MYNDLFDDPELIDEDDDFVDDDNVDNPEQFVVRIHNVADGATSLAMIADMLRDYANFLDSMHEDDFRLASAIVNGSGFAYIEG